MMDINKVYSSNSCGDFKVVEYINAKKVVVEFLGTGFRLTKSAKCISRGAVKDRLYPSVYGVGFVGIGAYQPSQNCKHTDQYKSWKRMLERCYSEKHKITHPSYKGWSVATEWHNFQNFAKWFDDNYVEGFHLDKDIKDDGNRIYSSETCLFVSQADNSIKASAKHFKFTNPAGEVVEVYNLVRFCSENNLTHTRMCDVHSGQRPHHKQWRAA